VKSNRYYTTTDALAVSILAIGLGEELWQAYLPRYLMALGGSAAVVGLFGSCRDFLDSAYQLPGGWLSDRLGARSVIRVCTAVAMVGYAVYALSWTWPMAFVGLACAMAWKAGAFPATFALVGDSLPSSGRVGAFTRQSLAVRLPRVCAAPLGGLLVWKLGLIGGVRAGAVVALAAGAVALAVQRRALGVAAVDAANPPPRPCGAPRLNAHLRSLLVAECFVRVGEAIAASFIILYVTTVRGVPVPVFGLLYALQQSVALAVYVPSARVAPILGSRPLVAVTFLFFALFPVAVVWLPGWAGLVAAFVAGGCKEIGEPARKASIVDACRAGARGREVGTYYAIRNLVVVPGGLLGGLLWPWSPALVLELAGAVSFAGFLIFLKGRDFGRRGW